MFIVSLFDYLHMYYIMLISYACFKDFELFQMDMKLVFLNGYINEDVYVSQFPGFLKVMSILFMFTNLKKLCMVSNKHLGLGMSDLVCFLIDQGFYRGR